jgi:hypothetical protein
MVKIAQREEKWNHGNYSSLIIQMGCSAESDEIGYLDHYISGLDTGLMGGHAYSIIDVFELDILPNPKKPRKKDGYGKHRILKLRNPWG